MNRPRIALVAGEASGDLLAAHLIEALKRRLPDAEFCGIGGPKMQRAGFDAWWPAETLAVRGYAEVLRHYRRIAGVRRDLLKRLLREKPDVFIGVDAPDFNLWLEAKLKRAGIRTVHYVSPSVWAWRGGRVKRIGRAVDRLLALFPFEPPLYEKAGVPVSYVGHPLADVLPLDVSRPAARELLGLPEAAEPVFALLPGSRQSEVAYMAELYIQTAAKLRERFPKAIFLVPLATRETRNLFEAALWKHGVQDWLLDELPLSSSEVAPERPGGVMKLLFGHAQDALAACDAALVASGTATLEAALLKTPMVITYRMSKWSWRLMKRMRYQPWVGLPNILAGQFVVPEFLQDDATPENLAQALGNVVLDAGVRMRLGNLFMDMHRQLRQNTAEKAAAAVLPLLGGDAA
jgi:lipid-A-disaccharide synthase